MWISWQKPLFEKRVYGGVGGWGGSAGLGIIPKKQFFYCFPILTCKSRKFFVLVVQDGLNIQPFLVNSTLRPRCPLRCGSIYNLHEPLLPDCFLTSNILFLKQPCFLESTFENHINWVILELWLNGIPCASNRKGMEHGPNDISLTKIPREQWNVCYVICDLGVRICDCEPSCDNVWHSSVTMTQLMARNAGLTRH